jgi:hypothetical protein
MYHAVHLQECDHSTVVKWYSVYRYPVIGSSYYQIQSSRGATLQ